MIVRPACALRPTRPARHVLLVAVTLLAALALSACTTVIAGTPIAAAGSSPAGAADTPDTDAADMTVWVDHVCGSLVTMSHVIEKKPAGTYSSPKALVADMVSYIDTFEAAIDTATSELDADRPAPVVAGDVFITKLTDEMAIMRTALEQTRANLKRAAPRSDAALKRALEPLTSVADKLTDLDRRPDGDEVDAAAADAPNCQEMQRLEDAEGGGPLLGI